MLDLSNARRPPSLFASPMARRLPPASRFSLRCGPQALRAAGAALGLSMADVACRSAQSGARSALWLGPDEQLLLAPVDDAATIEHLVSDALSGMPHSLVDISQRQLALEVGGARAQTVLSVGCPLDLDLSQFPVGMCTRTILGKADIVLWRREPETFHIEVWRSFADYASRFLAEAARELLC
jgi:sarcosine oxidase subunit gamma